MMILRLLAEGLRRRWRTKLAALATVAFGIAVLGTLLQLATQGRDRLALDLRGYGANLVARGEGGALLDESAVPGIKRIFWRNNITGLAPQRSVTVESGDARFTLVGAWIDREMPLAEGGTWRTGLLALQPAWREPGVIDGRAPRDGSDEALVGARLAQRLGVATGDALVVRRGDARATWTVTGVLRSGDAWDDRAIVPLEPLEAMVGGGVDRIEIGALAKPDDERSRKAPEQLSIADAEIMTCSPYLGTIGKQVQEAIAGSVVEPVRRVAEAETAYRSRLEAVLALLAICAAVVTTLGVHDSVRSALAERSAELGLMRALGARTSTLAAIFVGEGALVGAVGALAGTFLAFTLASVLSRVVLDAPLAFEAATVPALVLAGLLLAIAGSSMAVARALRLDPLTLLRSRR